MKKIFYATLLLCFVIAGRSQAQTLTGAQILRSARSIYDQGRLHELPALLEDALTKDRFQSDNERVEAYKILILTYIYLEEPEKADENMLQLLRTDHFFALSASDPIEFKNLYRKFRSKPVFSVGAKLGVNQSYASVIGNYYVKAESAGYGEYKPELGFQFALVFEKSLMKKGNNDETKFTLAPELMYATQSFTYNNDHIFLNDYEDQIDENEDDKFATDAHKTVQTRIQINALGQYKLGTSKFNPYVTVGPSAGYLMSSSFEGLLTIEDRFEVADPVDNAASYKAFNFSVIAGAGAKFKLGSIYLTADLRYQYGLFNVVDESKRYEYTSENNYRLFRYGFVNNDFSLSQAMFNIGLIYPYFNPKKVIK
jgi:hypothetical protein